MGFLLTLSVSAAFILLAIPGDLCMNIIGGQDVIPHSKPFMALIKDKKHYCGGSLIKKNWVLTAAHCQTKNAEVILGAHSRLKKEKEKQRFKIAKRIPYPCFDSGNKENDLMLLQLKGKVKINKAVKTTNLPNTGTDIKPGTRCQVIGWGTTNNQMNDMSDTLKQVNVTVIDRNTCNDKKHYNLQPEITKNMVCAGDVNGGKDSCSGDSGGPLICNGELKGITSFGKDGKCGAVQYPGVYTLLTASYINWIKKTIGGDLEDDFFAD
ncbi:PREDICTED: granzyme A-like [Crocodylus porosus]|uniref:granzyme A-like n=1 Tax=Crocodylus porosus TaxID=8502 RepID=UPI00093E02E2|nr:PREDICTED: granzyme A-like [Crocodylus porosus]